MELVSRYLKREIALARLGEERLQPTPLGSVRLRRSVRLPNTRAKHPPPNLKCLIPACFVASLASAIRAPARVEITVCRSQQSVEQVIEPAVSLDADDCRPARVARLNGDSGPVCVLDLFGGEETLLDDIRSLAEIEEWWTPCDAVGSYFTD